MDISVDPTQVNPRDRKELMEFLNEGAAKLTFVESALEISQMCFEKCQLGMDSSRLNSSEEKCARNCVDRYFESGSVILKKLE